MENYTQLTAKERYQIYAFLDMGILKSDIAKRLGRHKSTIYREIKQNSKDEIYFPVVAQQTADARKRKERPCKMQKDAELNNYVIQCLKKGWSPEQISGRMRLDGSLYYICPESLYRYIYREKNKELYYYLHYKKPQRGIRYGRKSRACRYGDIRLITNRSKEVETRESLGNWEGDSIIFNTSRKNSIATVVERKSRVVAIIKNEAIDSKTVMNNIASHFLYVPKKAFITITVDQGSEFANFRQLEMALGCLLFYCEIRSPWQKASNENTNGRIRWYFPRNTNIEAVTQEQLDILARQMNNTPRKCLGFQTPKEVYLQHCKNFTGLQF